MSSKAMFELSRKARDRHLDAKRRYHTFNCERYCLDEDVGRPVPIANQLMKRNGFFHYRKVLQLPRGDRNSLIGHLQPRVVAKMENILSTLEPKLRALGKQLPDDFQLDYAEHVIQLRWGQWQLVYWLPLVIFPYIEVLELSECSEFSHALKPIWLMFENSTNQPYKNPRGFSSLKELRVTQPRGRLGPGLDVLCLSTRLPTLPKVYSANTHMCKGNASKLAITEALSNVEEIQISGGAMDAEGLAQLLNGITALRAFSCNEFHDRGAVKTPRACLSALTEKAAASLETLAFVPGYKIFRHQHGDAFFSTSLKEFKTLKYAAITCPLFIQLKTIPPIPQPGHFTRNPSVMSFAADRRVKNVLKLADVLPPSLEILHLFHPQPYVPDREGNHRLGNVLEDMFVGLSRTWDECLPNLRCIIIQGKGRLSHRTKEECKRLGIILAFPTP